MAGRARQRMSGSRGLSLRARLLLLQIAVTAVFLLILGIVSTGLFAHNLNTQYDNIVLDESTRGSTDLAARPNGTVYAVLVTLSPFTVQVLNTGANPKVRRTLAEAIMKLGQTEVFRLAKRGALFPLAPPGNVNYHLTAAARVNPAILTFPRKPSVVVVAEQNTVVTRQLRGLIRADILTGGGLITLLAIGGRWLIARGLEPLDRMAKTANDITTRGDLAERMAGPDDLTEIGRLRAAINTMLDRIQQAFGARLNS